MIILLPCLLADDGGDDDQDAVLRGTYSMRKFAAQYAQNKGCSHAALDYQFLWVNQQMQDRYVQETIPSDNAHVTECLCKGGAISYQVKKEANISDEWILQFVVLNNARKYSSKVTLVLLGHALLWRIMDPVQLKILPTLMVSTVWQQVQYFVLVVVFVFFCSLSYFYFVSFITNNSIILFIDNILVSDENPIVKVSLSISWQDGSLAIVEYLDDDDRSDVDDDGNELAVEQKKNHWRSWYDDDVQVWRINARQSDNVQVTQLTSHHIILLRREDDSLKVQLGLMQDWLEKCMNKVNKIIINILQWP